MTSRTTNVVLSRAARWFDQLPLPPALIVAILVLLVAAGISGVNRIISHQGAATVPTPALAPIIIIASPLPQVPPTAVPVAMVAAQLPAHVTQRAIVVYGAPDLSTAIGAVEQGRPYQLLARWGAEWLKLDMAGSGIVYVRTSDVLNLPADLVDLAPPPAPQVVYVPAPAPLAGPPAAVPTPTPADYKVTNQPPADDFYSTPPHVDPQFQQSLVGSDPNALACGGSPMCGGLTNAQAQAEIDRQRNQHAP